MRKRSIHSAMAMALAAAVLTGCAQTESVDKSGGDTVVLRIGTIDSVNPNGQYFGSQAFVDALGEVSGGRLKVEMVNEYGDGAADAESKLVEAIASGELDGGMPSTRAFARSGISGLEPIEAPLTITSYAAQKALVSGPVADEVLDRLEGTGVVGLGLVVGPLRRPFAADQPLLGQADWEGARIRVYNSPVQADSVSALGAEPVDLSFGWIDEVRTGNLRGAEFDIAQYWTNGFNTETRYVTANVVLWPKVVVLSMSQKRWDSLTETQRTWVRDAADKAVQASVEASYDETTPARRLCEQGVRFVDATPDQLAALKERLAPVIEQLAKDPAGRALLDKIQAVGSDHPQPEHLDLPSECRRVEADPGEMGTVPDQTAGLPDGLYRVDITGADVESAGLSNGPGWSGTWTLEIREGTYAVTCRPLESPGRDCGNITFDERLTFETVLDAGFVKGTGSTIFFVYDAEVHSELSGCELPCFPLPTYQLTWDLVGDSLSFSDLRGGESYEKVLKPWRKIG